MKSKKNVLTTRSGLIQTGASASTSFCDSVATSLPRIDQESGQRGLAPFPFLLAGLGQQVLHAGGWLAIANVACKSEVSLTATRMSFANIFTSNMSLSESGRLRW